MLNKQKGFTLIELLVVVAIIGILASVVLASLNSARSKGKDAAIKSALSSALAQAAIVADTNTTGFLHADICGTTAGTALSATTTVGKTMKNISDNITKNGGALRCNLTSGTAAFYTTLASSATTYWCVDDNGFTGSLAAAPTTAGTCQ